LFERSWDAPVLALAANASRSNDAGPFKDAKVFGDSLSRLIQPGRQLRDRTCLPVGEPRDELKAPAIAERRKNSGWPRRYAGRHRISAGLPIAFGVIALIAGPFVAMRPRGAEHGLAGALHLIEGGLEMIIWLAAMGFAAMALSRRFRLYTIATVVLMVAFGAWSAMEIPQVEAGLITAWVGVKERIYWYAYQLWFIGLALTLLRERPSWKRPACFGNAMTLALASA
jgi:hypothetical protein